jgi:hypothetical protein
MAGLNSHTNAHADVANTPSGLPPHSEGASVNKFAYTPADKHVYTDKACNNASSAVASTENDHENTQQPQFASFLSSAAASRLKTPNPKAKLAFDPPATHVISPRTGLPKRMIILKQQ